VPWAAPERGAFQHGCSNACRSAFREVVTYRNMATEKFFRTYKHMNKACGIYSLMYKI
jgi:hypothetical protein